MKTKKVWNKMNPPTRARAVKRPAKAKKGGHLNKFIQLKYRINDVYRNNKSNRAK